LAVVETHKECNCQRACESETIKIKVSYDKKKIFLPLKICFRRKKSLLRRTKFLLTLVKATIYGHVKIKQIALNKLHSDNFK